MYTEECINIFLENQGQLFPQPVAASYEGQKLSWKTAWQQWWIPWEK